MEWHFFPQKLIQRQRNFGKTAYERPIIATQPQKRPNLLDVLGLRDILYGQYFIVHSVYSISIYSSGSQTGGKLPLGGNITVFQG